jgi:hypothetical protein
MDLTGRSGAQAAGGEIGRVNGEIITYEEYLAVYRNLYQQQQQAMDGPITVGHEPADRGSGVGPARHAAPAAAGAAPPRHPRHGRRDPAGRAVRAAAGAAERRRSRRTASSTRQVPAVPGVAGLDEQFLQQLEAYYRDMIPRSKLFFQTTAGLYVSDAQLWRMWRDANETATVRYVAFQPDAMVPDGEVKVTDQAIRSTTTANRDNFVRPAQASVRYVSLDRTPTQADTARHGSGRRSTAPPIAGGEDFDGSGARAAAAGSAPGRFFGDEFTVARPVGGRSTERLRHARRPGDRAGAYAGGLPRHAVESRARTLAQVRQILVPSRWPTRRRTELLDRADALERAAAVGPGRQAAAAAWGCRCAGRAVAGAADPARRRSVPRRVWTGPSTRPSRRGQPGLREATRRST